MNFILVGGGRIICIIVRRVETASALSHSQSSIARIEEDRQCEIHRYRCLSLVFRRRLGTTMTATTDDGTHRKTFYTREKCPEAIRRVFLLYSRRKSKINIGPLEWMLVDVTQPAMVECRWSRDPLKNFRFFFSAQFLGEKILFLMNIDGNSSAHLRFLLWVGVTSKMCFFSPKKYFFLSRKIPVRFRIFLEKMQFTSNMIDG